MLARIIQVVLFSIAPFVELRFAIPYGITKGLHPVAAFGIAVLATWATIIPMFILLDLFYERFFSQISVSRRVIEEIRDRGRTYVERWGVLGVGIYVSLPLPGPGVYSGAVLAWLFGLPRRKAVVAIALGVLVSAVLVTAISAPVIAIIRKLLAGVSRGY